jgi:hypothetical protein
MAPTTDGGKNHDIIDKEIQNRESLKYGNNPYDISNFMPKLNDIRHHKEVQKKNYNFNVITGSFNRRQ